MPNHFYFLFRITTESLVCIKTGGIDIPKISNGFRLLQSSYAKGINNQEDRTGNLFQQKTKAKAMDQYAITAFHYIHQNPVLAGLVTRPGDWEFSSWRDFAGLRPGTLCNLEKATKLLQLASLDWKEDTDSIEPERSKSFIEYSNDQVHKTPQSPIQQSCI